MTITKLNYEVYALDYLEGTLSKETQAAMDRFLMGHPEIAMELEAMKEVIPLTPDRSIIFQQKERLLKKEKDTKVIFLRKWQLSAIAASIALLIGLTSLWQLNFGGQDTMADVNHPQATEKSPINQKNPTSVLPAKEDIATTERSTAIAGPQRSASIAKKETGNSESSSKSKKLKQAPKNRLANTSSPKSSTLNSSSANLNKANLVAQSERNRAFPETALSIKNPIEASPRIKEEVVTISKTKEASNHPTVPVVAALPISELKVVNRTVDFKEIEIKKIHFTENSKELLAENTPKKRTWKSMLGKLPGDRISVSIIPSFFTDKGD